MQARVVPASILDRDVEVEDQSPNAGTLPLLAIFDRHEADLQPPGEDDDMYVQCYASTQGGFVQPYELVLTRPLVGRCLTICPNRWPQR